MFWKELALYAITLAVLLVLDALWLGMVAPKFYKHHIGHLMAKKVNFFAALLFYLIFIFGLLFFVIKPAMVYGIWWHAPVYGLIFGLVTYGTYDLTNQATLKKWSFTVTIVDLIWGMTLSGLTSLVVYFIVRAIF